MEKKITITHGHPYVEIGGIKWATMNVGAKDVTDLGLYFAWGETKGYKVEDALNRGKFGRKNYKFWDSKDYFKLRTERYSIFIFSRLNNIKLSFFLQNSQRSQNSLCIYSYANSKIYIEI